MKLKCPRCKTEFEVQAEKPERVSCPQCSGRFRLRPRKQASGHEKAHNDAAASSASEASSSQVMVENSSHGGGASSAPASTAGGGEQFLSRGTRLGGFEIRRAVGRGGMATVYRGIQLSLNRPVAIKVLAPRFARNPSFVQRFELEAGALANLNHPNIVNIIDKGVVDDQYFFVMELVEGINLEQLLQTVELNEKHYMHLIAEISKALTYVHSRGIVHRDVKPSNVLLNKQGLVKVSDFGIAHIVDAVPGELASSTTTVGTANYISPEQLSNSETVDARADIYSLGVTFYKMFTKQLPVGDFRNPSTLNPKLPRSVDGVIARAMRPDPRERFATVQEFCDQLLQCFQVASKENAAGGDSQQPFMFNTQFSSSRQAGANGDSSAGSLFMPSLWQSPSDSTISSSGPFPAAQGGQGAASDTSESEVLEEDEETPSLGKRVALIAGIVGVLLVIVLGLLAWSFWEYV